MDIETLVTEKLDKQIHDRDSFTCGVEVLDIFLKTRANKEQTNNLSITHIATHPDSYYSESSKILKPIIGYYTLSNNSLKQSQLSPLLFKGVPPTYDIPSILIGRFATSLHCHRMGVGEFLLRNAMEQIMDLATVSGIKCVTVLAKNENALKFYEKFGFTKLKDVDQLIMPIETLIKGSK